MMFHLRTFYRHEMQDCEGEGERTFYKLCGQQIKKGRQLNIRKLSHHIQRLSYIFLQLFLRAEYQLHCHCRNTYGSPARSQ